MIVIWEKFVKVWINFENLIENFKTFKKFLKVLKKILIKIWKNWTKIIIFFYYLFLLLAEAWVVPHPLQIFRCFGGGGSFPLPPLEPLLDEDALRAVAPCGHVERVSKLFSGRRELLAFAKQPAYKTSYWKCSSSEWLSKSLERGRRTWRARLAARSPCPWEPRLAAPALLSTRRRVASRELMHHQHRSTCKVPVDANISQETQTEEKTHELRCVRAHPKTK